jgi:Carbon starvation protein CstA
MPGPSGRRKGLKEGRRDSGESRYQDGGRDSNLQPAGSGVIGCSGPTQDSLKTVGQIGRRPELGLLSKLLWAAIACLGALGLGLIASRRGEPLNALWLVAAAACLYAVGYRFYSRCIAYRVLGVDDSRLAPAERLDDGRDYLPMRKWVLFGHHFAAIAGPGPLVGPILAAQFGYLPGTL